MERQIQIGGATVQYLAQVRAAAAIDPRRTLANVCCPAVLALIPAIQKDAQTAQRAINAVLAALTPDPNAGRAISADLLTGRLLPTVRK